MSKKRIEENEFLEKLKAESRYFPEITFRVVGESVYAGTIVRIKAKNGVWRNVYRFNCSSVDVKAVSIMVNALMQASYFDLNFCAVHYFEHNGSQIYPEDECQLEEKDRLEQFYGITL